MKQSFTQEIGALLKTGAMAGSDQGRFSQGNLCQSAESHGNRSDWSDFRTTETAVIYSTSNTQPPFSLTPNWGGAAA
jgi:hypothetical protein